MKPPHPPPQGPGSIVWNIWAGSPFGASALKVQLRGRAGFESADTYIDVQDSVLALMLSKCKTLRGSLLFDSW